MNEPTRYCTQCGYALEHIESPECPECGAPFEHRIRFTYSRESLEARRESDRRKRLWHVLAAAVVYCVPRFLLFPILAAHVGLLVVAGYLLWVSLVVWLVFPIIETSRIHSVAVFSVIGGGVGGLATSLDGLHALLFGSFVGTVTGLIYGLRQLINEKGD